ncbi:MAG: hypothetical protein H8E21_05715 [Gammaproteobacteria bacterium]|nr:hypothetical protein [Gammaproteobacteria bacterium]
MNKKSSKLQTLSRSLLLLSLIQLSACSDEAPTVAAAESTPPPVQKAAPVAPATQTQATATTPAANNGIVKSVQHLGGYSYIETDINGSIFWIASAITSIKPDDKIAWNDYAIMRNFTSKSMNRTFDQILFVDKVVPAAAMIATGHTGIVTEAMDAAGYSYIQVEEKGKKIWLAAPVSKVTPGQSISWNGSSPMHNFSSQSLNRTFDEIFFVGAIQVNQI